MISNPSNRPPPYQHTCTAFPRLLLGSPARWFAIMTESVATSNDAAAQRAAEQARLRKERREAKIKAGGSARLNKITGIGGRITGGTFDFFSSWSSPLIAFSSFMLTVSNSFRLGSGASPFNCRRCRSSIPRPRSHRSRGSRYIRPLLCAKDNDAESNRHYIDSRSCHFRSSATANDARPGSGESIPSTHCCCR